MAGFAGKVAVTGLALLATAAGTARAEPLDPKQVPADAKWVLHVDMDAVRQSKVWGMVLGRANREAGGQLQQKLDAAATLLGSRFPEDLHGVTLLGRGFTEESGVMLVHANMDRQKLAALVKLNPGYATSAYGDHEISKWTDEKKGHTMYGSFAGDRRLVLGRSQEQVQAALDVLDGKGKALAAESLLASAGKGAGAMIYLAGDTLAELQKKQGASPILAQVNSAWLTIMEGDADLVVKGSVNAKSAEAAKQMQATLDGIKALVMLSGTGEAAEPKAKFAAEALQRAALSLSGSTLSLDWPVSLAAVKGVVDHAPSPARIEARERRKERE